MPKTIAPQPVRTTLVIRDKNGKVTGGYRVEVFTTEDGDFGVRFMEGEIMKGLEAVLPASAASDALRRRRH